MEEGELELAELGRVRVDEILLGRFYGEELADDDLAPRRRQQKGHTYYRAKTEHVALDVDNALGGTCLEGGGLRKFQLPVNWRDDMSNCLEWDCLLPA